MPSDSPGLALGQRPAPVLRESIRVRCKLIRPTLVGLVAIAAVVVPSLWSEVPARALALWIGPLLLAVAWRTHLAAGILAELDRLGDAELRARDDLLLFSSVLIQLSAGSGMWSVAQGGLHEVALFMTLAVSLYGVGVMINLASDYRSFRLVMPLVMGQGVLYWVLEGGTGWGIAATLVLLMILMLGAVRRSDKTFSDSVLMRFERAELLARVQQEQERVEAALDDARAANRAKSMFLAAASHDLRQPLYAISLLADTLALRVPDDPARALVARQRQAIGILRGLFDNLLDLSRFEAGRIVPAPMRLPLAEILEPLATQFSAMAAEKSLAWRHEAPPVWVHADPSLLQRLLSNLLSNAVRYTQEGEIALLAAIDGERVSISVVDTGPGIATELRARAFEEFAQLSNPQRNREQGLGLGLAIARHISEITDARLELDSDAGRGCHFKLSAPLVEAEPVPRLASDLSPPPGMRVWAADDDTLVCEALAHQFEAWRLEHRISTSGSELRAALREGDAAPDALILDAMLGEGESGVELARWFARRMPSRNILIVTGNVDHAHLSEIEAAGFAVLPKPVPAAELGGWLAGVGRAVHGSALRA